MKPRKLKKVLSRIAEGRWPKKRSKTARRFRRWCLRMIVLLNNLYPALTASLGLLDWR